MKIHKSPLPPIDAHVCLRLSVWTCTALVQFRTGRGPKLDGKRTVTTLFFLTVTRTIDRAVHALVPVLLFRQASARCEIALVPTCTCINNLQIVLKLKKKKNISMQLQAQDQVKWSEIEFENEVKFVSLIFFFLQF